MKTKYSRLHHPNFVLVKFGRTQLIATYKHIRYPVSVMAALLLNACATQLKPFTSDGCSAFPDGTLQENDLWLSCCVAHDYAYWQGGTYAQRLDADKALKQCVSEIGQPEIAQLMLAGVRVGGSPYWPTPFRWGYGWAYPKSYKPLNADEKNQIEAQSSHPHKK